MIGDEVLLCFSRMIGGVIVSLQVESMVVERVHHSYEDYD